MKFQRPACRWKTDKVIHTENPLKLVTQSIFVKSMRLVRITGQIILLAMLFSSHLLAQNHIEGVIRDASGAVVQNAKITLQSGTFKAAAVSNPAGKFSFENVPISSGTISASAKGFATAQIEWKATITSLDITLSPSKNEEQVVVSAARSEMRLSDTPGSTVLLSTNDIASTPALTTDDMLRQVPGFTLFRRSGSRTANPTSQGVSLRGLGASGPSRALVLEDGIPIGDPFGGWIYWDRIPKAEVASVEVFRGGTSDLYGSNALGGVMQFISREPEAPSMNLETSYGNERTPDLSFWTGTRAGPWDFQVATDLFHTDGYIVVPASIRGSVDAPANSEHATVDTTIGRKIGDTGRIFGQIGYLDEARENGTPIQTNDTHVVTSALGLDEDWGGNSLSLRVYGDAQSYNQSFSSIAADRNSESLVDLQHVPAQQLGMSAQWSRAFGKMQTLIVGADGSEVMGASDEQLFTTGIHTANTIAGGRQRSFGWFGEDIFRFHNQWTVILGGRLDYWSNFNSSSLRIPISTAAPVTDTIFADRSNTAFDPRFSVLRSLGSHFSATASIYRAFRAPTLNELYRGFRLGNVLTNSNANLIAERLTGAEAGLNAAALDRKLDLQGTFFWSDIVDPIENVTLTTTPSLITRQRQNLGRTRSRGIELDGEIHITNTIDFSAGYAFTDATVVSFPAGLSLQGLRIPQVPQNQLTFEARYWDPTKLMLSVQGRFVGMQFDDDQNQFPLDKFFTVDLIAAHSLGHRMEAFIAAENLTDQRYQVAKTPTLNIGPPILYRVGLRWNYAGK
jgi:outer membrane receptor protein involved in Fe transport